MVFNSGYIDLIGFEIIGHCSVKPRCYWLQCFQCNKWKSSETDKSIHMEIPGGRGEQPEALWNGKSGGVGAQTVNNPPWGGGMDIFWNYTFNKSCWNSHFS